MFVCRSAVHTSFHSFVCMFLCICEFVFVCICVSVFVCICVSVFVCICVFVFVCSHVYLSVGHLSAYLFVCLFVCIFVCSSVCLYVLPPTACLLNFQPACQSCYQDVCVLACLLVFLSSSYICLSSLCSPRDAQRDRDKRLCCCPLTYVLINFIQCGGKLIFHPFKLPSLKINQKHFLPCLIFADMCPEP